MTDISDKNIPNELAREEELEPKASLRLAPEPTNKPEYEPALGLNGSKVDERVQEPSEAAKTPAAAPISKAGKATSTLKQTTPIAKHDSSISMDEDGDTSANTKLFIVDALAAAIAIAFTVLILQDSLPFLK